MKQIIDKLVNSFDNNNLGFSSKKLTAFVIVLCVVSAHIKWLSLGNFSQLEMVLTIDFTFIATMFGINEYGKKNKKDE
jgi:hypothetical protein